MNLKEGMTAGFTGHFYAGRGMDLLFELARALPDVNFIWAGGTPEAVAEWRLKLNSVRASNVTLTGFIENSRLPLIQAAADILLMPYGSSISASSGQDIAEVINPMKMFEYMAAGRAIITADLPVIREVLDETRAVFCPPDDAAAWKAAIESLMTDEKRRGTLASNARRESEKYTWLSARPTRPRWNGMKAKYLFLKDFLFLIPAALISGAGLAALQPGTVLDRLAGLLGIIPARV